MATARLSPKFQISIPKEVREEMALTEGQVFYVIPRGSSIQLVPKRAMADFKGVLAGARTDDVRDRKDRV